MSYLQRGIKYYILVYIFILFSDIRKWNTFFSSTFFREFCWKKINEKGFNVNGSKYHVTKSYLKQALGKHTIYSRRVWEKHEFTATNKQYLANNYSVIPQKFSEKKNSKPENFKCAEKQLHNYSQNWTQTAKRNLNVSAVDMTFIPIGVVWGRDLWALLLPEISTKVSFIWRGQTYLVTSTRNFKQNCGIWIAQLNFNPSTRKKNMLFVYIIFLGVAPSISEKHKLASILQHIL